MGAGISKTGYWKEQVIARQQQDGWPAPSCCWCAKPLTYHSATLEHLLARTHGGFYTLDNLDLACKPCNNARGNDYYPPIPKHLRSE